MSLGKCFEIMYLVGTHGLLKVFETISFIR